MFHRRASASSRLYRCHLWIDTGSITRLRLAGQQYDQGSELYYLRARYYDPQLGRFLSEDPIGVSGGLNLYAYAGNDPINKIDPTGTSEQCGWAWFEYTYRYIEGPHKGEISRVEYGQEWVCDHVADPPASAPSEYPAKGRQKPWQQTSTQQSSASKDPDPAPSCVARAFAEAKGALVDGAESGFVLGGVGQALVGGGLGGLGGAAVGALVGAPTGPGDLITTVGGGFPGAAEGSLYGALLGSYLGTISGAGTGFTSAFAHGLIHHCLFGQ